MHRFVFLVLA